MCLLLGVVVPPWHSASAGDPETVLIPDYRVFSAMLQSLLGESPLASIQGTVELLSPRLNSLSRDHGVDLRDEFDEGIAADDRDRVIRAVVLAALFEAIDAAEAIERNRLTGWTQAKHNATISYLTYAAVAGELKIGHPEQHEKVNASFTALIGQLKRSDLTTPTAGIDKAKRDLLGRLSEMAASVTAPEADVEKGGQ